MNQSTIAIIDANILSGHDELAREDLLARLRDYEGPCVTPLWVNWLRERADLRIICMVHELAKFDDFLIDVVRSAQGVIGTSAALSFGGRANIANLMDIVLTRAGSRGLKAATVRIVLSPGRDNTAFTELWNLPAHPRVKPVWLLRTYHSFDADLSMLLLAPDEAALSSYVMSWIRPVPGVVDTTVSNVTDWSVLASPDAMIQVAEQFFTLNNHER